MLMGPASARRRSSATRSVSDSLPTPVLGRVVRISIAHRRKRLRSVVAKRPSMARTLSVGFAGPFPYALLGSHLSLPSPASLSRGACMIDRARIDV
ncbi:hypothetical protein A3862_15075 [Methylobacterium sp. XJLW]|nr:hypothetical protein A3862_15075 [Methylobacterium sp. XJLW]